MATTAGELLGLTMVRSVHCVRSSPGAWATGQLRRNCAAYSGDTPLVTFTATLGVAGPNHSTNSWTIRHWKAYVPGVGGAVTSNVKVTSPPGATLATGRSTRVVTQSGAPSGWEPRRYGVAVSRDHGEVPSLRMVTDTVYRWP